MPELKVVYIAGFNLGRNTGRVKATLEKTSALKGLLAPGCFRLYFPGGSSSRIMAYLKVFFFDWVMLRRLLFVDRNTRIIQRTTFLPLTNIYLKLRGVQMIYELHTDFRDEIRYYPVSLPEKLVLHLYVFAERLNIRLATKIIYNHPVLKQLMEGSESPGGSPNGETSRSKKPSIFTYNGSNPHSFYPMDMSACRSELGFRQDARYYIIAGSLSRWRGVDLLINIFKSHMPENDILFILGNASHGYGLEMRALAGNAPNIVFHDEVDSSSVVRYMNAADICLVPVKPILRSPGNPLKLYDYIACGKPVVGQEDVIGCADEIIRYKVGTVTDFYDPARGAHDLTSFHHTLDPLHYCKHNREVAIHDVSWEKRMKEWIEFINS